MKKNVLYLLISILLLYVLLSKTLYKVSFFQKDLLQYPVTASENVVLDNGRFYSNTRDDQLKIMHTMIHLKKDRSYLIEFDLKVEGKNREDFFLIYDFKTPQSDKEEHEHRVEIQDKSGVQKISGVLKSGDLSGNALFRIFYYNPGIVEITNLKVSRIRSTAVILQIFCYLLLGGIFLKVLSPIIVSWDTVRNALQTSIQKIIEAECCQNIETPHIAFLLLLCFYFFSVITRFIIALSIEVPLIASDELAYKNMAYSYFLNGDFYSTEQYFSKVEIPNVLYSYFISFAFWFKSHFFIAIKMINSLMINLVVFPVYLLTTSFADRKRALVVSFIVLLLPTMNYTNFTMAESLYLTVFMFTFYYACKSLTPKMSKNNLYAGVSLALLILTKPNAIAFVLALIFTIFFLLIYHRKNKQHFIGYLSSGASTAVICILVFFILNFVLKGNFSYDIGLYGQVIKKSLGDEIFTAPFLSMVLAHFFTLSLLFLLPFFVTISSAIHALQVKDIKKLTFLVLGILLFLGHLAMVFKLTMDISGSEHYHRLHARYYFMTLPFFLIAFISFYDTIKWSRLFRAFLFTAFLATTLLNILYFFPEYADHGLLIVDNPYLTWFLFHGKKVIIHLSIIALIIFLYYVRSSKRNYMPYFVFSILFCFIANKGEMQYSLMADEGNKNKFARYIPFIKSNIADETSDVVLVSSEWPYRLQTAFWLPYRYSMVYDRANGSKISPSMIPEKTEYLILIGEYELDFSHPGVRRSIDKYCTVIPFQ